MVVRSQTPARSSHRRFGTHRTRLLPLAALGIEPLEERRLLHAGFDDEPLLLTTPLPLSLPDAPLAAPLADEPQGALHPLSAVPAYSSFPQATAKLYLDFNGFFESVWGGYSNITTPAMDLDGDTSTFSDNELATIEQVWRQVAEDFAPFNIDVTTVEPASFADRVGMRVAIGGDGAWYGSAGGVGYVNSYTNSGLTNTVYVFTDNLGSAKSFAEASSHEAGHSYGLSHQSQYNASGGLVAEYYPGPGDGRAPIMGLSYSATRGLWWNGTSTSSTTIQDDLSTLARSANAFGYRTDDHGNTFFNASTLNTSGGALVNQGVLHSTADRDYFAFSTGAGTVDIAVTVPVGINNLDAVVELRNEFDTLIASSDPAGQFGASITTNVAAGSYRVVVASHGGYGDIGTYTLTVTAQSPSVAGTVFVDVDQDGLLDAGEPGLSGARVFDDLNGNGLWEPFSHALFPSTDTPVPIPDLASTSSLLNVGNLSGTIVDVNVRMTLLHPTTSQLTGILMAPDGTSVTLMAGNGGSGDNFIDTVFDSDAAVQVSAGSAPFTATFRPMGNLATLNVKNPNGQWKLMLSDVTFGDVGSLSNWSLDLTTTGAEPSTTTNSDGEYYFPFAQPGTHHISQVPVLNYQPSGAGFLVNTAPGVTVGDLNFGNFGSSIAGRVYRDLNLNGSDDGEPGLDGITVFDDLNNNGSRDQFLGTNSFASADVPRAITDHNTTLSQLEVSGLVSPLLDVNVRLNLTHTYDGDLRISLRAPDGTLVRLTNRHGGGGENFLNTVFDDEAATSIASGSAPFAGSYRPVDPLSAFDGKNGNGTWQLVVADEAGGDSGVLSGWSLDIFRNELEPAVVTELDGSYRLGNVNQGNHVVRVVVPAGGTQTSPAGGGNAVLVDGYTAAFDRDFGLALAGVAHRAIFYNQSKWDGNSATINSDDDAAIASDKVAYLAGSGSASPENVTSYTHGINGIMVDLPALLVPLSASDFTFKIGTTNSPQDWALAPAPSAVVVRPGAGQGGTDRVEITWANDSIVNTWLQVVVKGNDHTGLAASDIFYFGSRVGDTFAATPPNSFTTNASDEVAVRLGPGLNAGITNLFDFNRDMLVNANDAIAARLNGGFLPRIDLGPEGAPLTAPVVKEHGAVSAIASALAVRASDNQSFAQKESPPVVTTRATEGLAVTATSPAATSIASPFSSFYSAKIASIDRALDDGLLADLLDDALAG